MVITLCILLLSSGVQQADDNPFGDDQPAAAPAAPAETDSIAKWIADLGSDDVRRREQAAIQLGEARDKAERAVPALTAALADAEPVVRGSAACALGKIGVPTIDVLTGLKTALTDTGAEVAGWAALSLGLLHPSDPAYAEAIAPLLGSADPLTVIRVASALVSLGVPEPALTKLREQAESGNADDVAGYLLRVGQHAEPAVALLAEILSTSEDGWTRRNAAAALSAIGRGSLPALPVLIAALDDDYARALRMVVIAVGNLAPESSGAVPKLIGLVRHPDVWVRRNSVTALGQMPADAGPITEALVPCLADSDPWVRSWAADKIGEAGLPAAGAAPLLALMLNDRESFVRGSASRALRAIGQGDLVTWHYATQLQDVDDEVRRAAAEVLGSFGPNAASATPFLIEALDDSGIRVRRFAAIALGQIGPGAAEAVPKLVAALKDRDGWVCRNAAEALGLIGVANDEVVKWLSESLRSQDPGLRERAAFALGEMGDKAGAALAPMLRLFLDEEETVRAAARTALVGDVDDDQLKTTLKQLTGHADVEVKQAAEAALRALENR